MAKARGFSSSRMRGSCFTGSRPTNAGPNGSYTPSTGSDREPLGQNVTSGIGIAVVSRAAVWAYPFTYVQRKRIEDMLADTTGLRRGIEPIDLDQGPSIPLGFIFQLADEFAPAHIADRFGERVVLNHILDGQALHADHLVFVDDACREFVLVVSASIADTSVDASYFETSFVAVTARLLFPGVPSLSFCQLLLILGKIAWVANGLTCRKGYHRLDAQIEPDHLRGNGKRLDVLCYQDGDEVASSRILGDRDRTGFGIFGQRSVPLDGQRLIHLGKREGLSIPREGIGGIGSRLVVLLFLEGGIASSSLEEIHKGTIQVTEGLLKGDRRHIGEPGVVLLESGKHSSQIVVVEALPLLSIGRLASREAPIIDEAAASKRLSQLDPMPGAWIEPELVGPLRFAHCLFAFLISFDVFFQSGQDFSTQRAMMPLCNCFHLLQDVSREADRERFRFFLIVFHASILQQDWMHVKWLGLK